MTDDKERKKKREPMRDGLKLFLLRLHSLLDAPHQRLEAPADRQVLFLWRGGARRRKKTRTPKPNRKKGSGAAPPCRGRHGNGTYVVQAARSRVLHDADKLVVLQLAIAVAVEKDKDKLDDGRTELNVCRRLGRLLQGV